MNIFREEIRKVYSESVLETCRADGDRMPYQDRATSPKVWVWAIPGKETFDSVNDRSLEEQHCHRNFVVPTQYGCGCENDGCSCSEVKQAQQIFPPQFEPSKNAIIYYEGWDWSVDRWNADSLRASYTLETTRHVARRVITR